jgi:MFS family permease
VWAYGVGGAKAVGLWAATRFILSSFVAPFAAAFADKFPRKKVMVTADVSRCVLIVIAATCIANHTPAAPVFVVATLSGMFNAVFRPAVAAWTPALVERPEELTASNAVASTLESVAFFVGPAIGAFLIAATNVQTVFYVNAATFVWSALLVLAIRPRESAPDSGGDDEDEENGALQIMIAGFAEIKRSRDLTVVLFLSCAQTIVMGGLTVYGVVLAVRVLHTGPHGVGYIDAVFGVGAIVGGFVALARATLNKLAADLALGTF